MLQRLWEYGVQGKMFNTIKELCKYTKNRIILNNKMSNSFETIIGVKKGDSLSSFLFNVCI